MRNYTVIKDTREQDGWTFSAYDKCDGMKIDTLPTGDYTIEGFEDVVCVERKASVSELANNLGKKKKAFYAEMARIKDFPFKFLVFEFSFTEVAEYPYSLLNKGEKEEYFKYLNYQKAIEEDPHLIDEIEEVIKPNIGKRLNIVEQSKVKGKYLIKSLMELQIWYDVKIMFCDNKNNAFLVCNSLFKRLNELFHKET
tara:strand:+ start:20 stop:610 length:591 start_codon:yes stop_codon:yes gene_type:complete